MKIDTHFFKQNFKEQMGYDNQKVITGPAFGVDASVIKVSPEIDMICASDPLSYIPMLGAELSAYLSIHLIANDIMTSGVAPQFFQMVLNLPETMTQVTFIDYWKAIHLECKKHKIAITGGHTGWVMGQNSTVSGGGTMFSMAPKGTLLTSDKAQAGDVILMTKFAAIASTSILGLQFPVTLKNILPQSSNIDFKDLFHQISILKEGHCVAEFMKKHPSAVHAMHDVTEGGILNAAAEFALASKLSAEIDVRLIPVLEEQRLVCEKFNLSPYEIVGAGSLLISVSQQKAEELMDYLTQNHVKVTAIGVFKDSADSVYLDEQGKQKKLETLKEDPYWRAFGNSLREGWK